MAGLPDGHTDILKALKDEGLSYVDKTKPIHAIKYRWPLYRRPGNPVGLVLHNTAGMITLDNLVGHWQKKNVPSHFAIDQTGRIGLYVQLDFADRATENTNRHVSIELQAVENGDITAEQVSSAGFIAGFLHSYYGTSLAIAKGKGEPGISHHSLFVDPKNPDGHFNCPGEAIIGKKPKIVEAARKFSGQLAFDDRPMGSWWVRVPSLAGIWRYEFQSNLTVKWVDPHNNKSGTGTWTQSGGAIRIKWPSTGSTETWPLPLKPSDYEGTYTTKRETYDFVAERITT